MITDINTLPIRINEPIRDSLWWLSFCDTSKPKGLQFIGIIIIPAINFIQAVAKTHVLNINPGGEIEGVELPSSVKISSEYQNRLLSKKELYDSGLLP